MLFFSWGLSGFQIRRVRSCEPVAIRWPVGFQAIVRVLLGGNRVLALMIAGGKGREDGVSREEPEVSRTYAWADAE